MKIRTMLLSALLAAGAAMMPAHARSGVDVSIGITIAPPPPAVIVTPPPRHGHVWAPGYWTWNGHRHVWVPGRWLVARPGYVWVPEHWVQKGHRWYFVPGHWQRVGPPHPGKGWGKGRW